MNLCLQTWLPHLPAPSSQTSVQSPKLPGVGMFTAGLAGVFLKGAPNVEQLWVQMPSPFWPKEAGKRGT